MSKLFMETNASDVYRRFEDLSYKEMQKALKTGVKKALTEIRKNTVSSLRSKVNNTNKRNPKYNDTLQKGVRVTRIWVNEDGTVAGKVRIDSTRDSGSGSFRLPILESGSYKVGTRYQYTRDKTRKHKAVGVLRPYHFFKEVMDTKDSYYQSTLRREIDKAVDKINSKL